MRKRLIVAALAVAGGLAAAIGNQTIAKADSEADNGYSFAVIGDVPYGDAQLANFPRVVDQINRDKGIQFTVHLGDIKSGSSKCTNEYFATIRAQFDRFAKPLIYTPGDNEWTDCHRTNNGAYNPLERLTKIRQVFFPRPGRTLGLKTMTIQSQASTGFPENVRFDRADVTFAALHIVGSNNSMANWTGKTAPTAAQLAEVQARTAADVAAIKAAFAQASDEGNEAVVLMLQTDMFDPTVPNPIFSEWSAFVPLVRTIAEETVAFHKPVILFDGDSHVFNADHPLTEGSPWLSFYGVSTPAPNLTRVTVDGSTGLNNWLRVTVNEEATTPLTWVKVPFS